MTLSRLLSFQNLKTIHPLWCMVKERFTCQELHKFFVTSLHGNLIVKYPIKHQDQTSTTSSSSCSSISTTSSWLGMTLNVIPSFGFLFSLNKLAQKPFSMYGLVWYLLSQIVCKHFIVSNSVSSLSPISPMFAMELLPSNPRVLISVATHPL